MGFFLLSTSFYSFQSPLSLWLIKQIIQFESTYTTFSRKFVTCIRVVQCVFLFFHEFVKKYFTSTLLPLNLYTINFIILLVWNVLLSYVACKMIHLTELLYRISISQVSSFELLHRWNAARINRFKICKYNKFFFSERIFKFSSHYWFTNLRLLRLWKSTLNLQYAFDYRALVIFFIFNSYLRILHSKKKKFHCKHYASKTSCWKYNLIFDDSWIFPSKYWPVRKVL